MFAELISVAETRPKIQIVELEFVEEMITHEVLKSRRLGLKVGIRVTLFKYMLEIIIGPCALFLKSNVTLELFFQKSR